MRIYMMEITKVPAESQKVIKDWHNGERITVRDSDWKPEGWVEYLDQMAEQGEMWAVNAVEDDYRFFWPAHGKKYFSRSSAADKKAIVERWGGTAIILEAEVSEFVPTFEANARRKDARNQKRIDALKAKIRSIDPSALNEDVPF